MRSRALNMKGSGMRGEDLALVRARQYIERYGGDIIGRRNGFTIVYRRVCGDDGCRKVLVWFRQSPITEKTVEYMRRILSRTAHDEVWLVRIYRKPDFTEDYKEFVSREYYWEDLYEDNV